MFNSYDSIPKMKTTRRIACHEIASTEDNSLMKLAVVEIRSGEVIRCYPLSGELPCTEWMPGRIVLQRDDKGLVRAYYNNVIIN